MTTEKKSILTAQCGNKEKTIREWFVEVYGDATDSTVVFPTITINDMLSRFEGDVTGMSISYGMFNGTIKKIRKEFGIVDSPRAVINVRSTTASSTTSEGTVEAAYEALLLTENGSIDIAGYTNCIQDMEFPNFKLFRSGKAIDRIMSDHTDEGGNYGGTTTIVIGESGAGKTTLLLDFVESVIENGNSDLKALYVSSEMTRNDLFFAYQKSPAVGKIPTIILNDFLLNGQLMNVLIGIFSGEYDIIILDSFEDTVVKMKEFLGMQKTAATAWLINQMIKCSETKGTAIFAIQHLNKDGNYAGGTFLKHTTTAMMEIRIGEHRQRFVEYSKNRRGGSMIYKPVFFGMDAEGKLVYDDTELTIAEDTSAIRTVNNDHLRMLESSFTGTFGQTAEELEAAEEARLNAILDDHMPEEDMPEEDLSDDLVDNDAPYSEEDMMDDELINQPLTDGSSSMNAI